MINDESVKYIISQIKFLQFYKNHVIYYDKKLKDIDESIKGLSFPHSPNGGISIGKWPNDIRVKVTGHGQTNEEIIAGLVTEQKRIEKELHHYYSLWYKADRYYKTLLEHHESDFIIDYFNGISHHVLEEKYSLSNPYDHIRRIIKQHIKRI